MAKLSLCVAGALMVAGAVLPVARAQSDASTADEQRKRDLFLQARSANRKEARGDTPAVPQVLKNPKNAPPHAAYPVKGLNSSPLKQATKPNPSAPPPPSPPAGSLEADGHAGSPAGKRGPVARIVGLFKPKNATPGDQSVAPAPPSPVPPSTAPETAVARTSKPPSPPPPKTAVASSTPSPRAPSVPAPRAPAGTTPAPPKTAPPKAASAIASGTPAPKPAPKESALSHPSTAPVVSQSPPPSPPRLAPALPPPPAQTPVPEPPALSKLASTPATPAKPVTPAPIRAATPPPVPPEAPPAPRPAPAPRETITAAKTSISPPVTREPPVSPLRPDLTAQPPAAVPVPVPIAATVPAPTAPPLAPEPVAEPVAPATTTPEKPLSPAPGAVGAADLAQIRITADNEAEFDLETSSLVFIGHAVMEAPGYKLEGDRITVSVTETGDGITSAQAVGSVKVRIPSKGIADAVIGQSAKADFNPAAGSFTLLGWPEVTAAGQRSIAADAETKIILHTDGRVETIGETQPGIAGR